MQKTNLNAVKRHAKRLGNLFCADPAECGLFFVDLKVVDPLIIFNKPVNIDNAGSLAENFFNLSGQRDLVESTGGPGGISTILAFPLYFNAMFCTALLTFFAMSWLCRLRSPLCIRLT